MTTTKYCTESRTIANRDSTHVSQCARSLIDSGRKLDAAAFVTRRTKSLSIELKCQQGLRITRVTLSNPPRWKLIRQRISKILIPSTRRMERAC